MDKIQIKKDSKILFIGDSISDPKFNFRMMKDIKGRNIYALQLKKRFKMFKKFKSKVKGVCSRAKSAVRHVKAGALALFLAVASPVVTFAQNAAGTSALAKVTEEIAKYIPFVVKLCYAIAGVVAIVGAISVYIAMNNEEQDVKKKIMMVVGACIFLVAAAQALPLFFGL